jgi:hypothetical protein
MTTANCTQDVQALSRLAPVVVVGGAASSTASAAAAATAACEAGEPSPSLIRVRPGNEVVAGFGPAPAADIPREAGAGAAGLRRGGAFLQCSPLGFGDQVRLHPLRQLHGQLRVASRPHSIRLLDIGLRKNYRLPTSVFL